MFGRMQEHSEIRHTAGESETGKTHSSSVLCERRLTPRESYIMIMTRAIPLKYCGSRMIPRFHANPPARAFRNDRTKGSETIDSPDAPLRRYQAYRSRMMIDRPLNHADRYRRPYPLGDFSAGLQITGDYHLLVIRPAHYTFMRGFFIKPSLRVGYRSCVCRGGSAIRGPRAIAQIYHFHIHFTQTVNYRLPLRPRLRV